DPEEQLHEVRVGRKDGRLHQVDASTAHVLEYSDEERPLRKAKNLACADLDPQLVANRRRQARTRAPSEDQRILIVGPTAPAREDVRAAEDAHPGHGCLTQTTEALL